jgi:hypothetical protein
MMLKVKYYIISFSQKYNVYYSYTQKTDELSIMDFGIKLSYQLWEDIFAGKNVNTAFNNFLNTNLRIFYSSFSLKKCILNPTIRFG